MNKLLILSGIPGSGKTTWAKEFLKGKTDWIRVSRDDLRRMRGDYWIPKQEGLITEIEEFIVMSALDYNYNVLIDATNLNEKTIKRWTDIGETYNVEIEFKFFSCTLEEAIKRDSLRTEKVGEKIIRDFYNKYVKGKLDELPNNKR